MAAGEGHALDAASAAKLAAHRERYTMEEERRAHADALGAAAPAASATIAEIELFDLPATAGVPVAEPAVDATVRAAPVASPSPQPEAEPVSESKPTAPKPELGPGIELF